LDGTFVSASVRNEEFEVFKCRKGFTAQNVLLVVRFDMTFSYILAGWEGTAHDGRVLKDAYTKGLGKYPNDFYLGDAGYALSCYVLTPYRGVRYHLKEWGAADERPQNREELFNLRHAMARNIIERTIGVWKRRFPILDKMPSYPFLKQIDIVIACALISNWIRLNAEYDDVFDGFRVEHEDEVNDEEADDPDEEETAILNGWRDGIAQAMWNQYQLELADRGLI